ncbi:MAG: hypothetical protein GF329_16590 [Candidatus Lokiarchaeota archaeon]|nr:hypothetical protein [Candidatus Lokiarchaeota archaeon]
MREIPHYGQLYNTCGLSSLLMIANPENSNLQYLLDEICEYLGVSTTFNRALNWQLACGYLLLKMSFSRILGYQLRKNFGTIYDNYKILLENQIRQKIQYHKDRENKKTVSNLNTFLEHRIIRKKTLRLFMDDMKTNLELKLLAFLFGGKFIKNNDSNDGTGCHIFKKNNKKTRKRLMEMIDDGLMLGLFNHWMAVRNLEKNDQSQHVITINDPLRNRESILLSEIDENHRFYHYRFDLNLQKKMDRKIRRACNLRKYPKIP